MRHLMMLLTLLGLDLLDPAAVLDLSPETVRRALVALARGASVCVRPYGRGYSASLWLDDLEAADVVHHGRTLALSALAAA